MSEKTQGARNIAEEAFGNERKFKQLVGALSGPSRRERQFGAAVIDALNRPEAQTRWECLDILTTMVDHDSRTCDKAVPGAETALFDEESGPVRLAAMRFLCKLGATTENRSERVWPLIDEAIDFSAGKLAPSVKKELGARMAFDASNGKGPLKRRAQQIIDNVQN